MKNKKGFISMTLVYTFLIVFMFLMLAILRAYTEKDKFLQTISDQIDSDISESKKTKNLLVNKIIEDNGARSDAHVYFFNIANKTVGNGNGFYYTSDDSMNDENADGKYERMYYFRGETENNHLVFANLCFRIIRFNENGSVRIMYNGPYVNYKCPKVGEIDRSIGKASFSTAVNDSDYISLVDGNTPIADAENNQSPIISVLNRWYVSSFLKIRYGGTDYYSDDIDKSAIYCNNRETYAISGTTYYKSKKLIPTFIDKNNRNIYNFSNIQNELTFKCGSANDRLSTESKTLLYPVGLVTAQDVVLAGGYFNDSTDLYKGGAAGFKNKKYYMYNTDNKYWTMTAADTSHPIYVDENGTLKYGEYSSAEYDIIPVISLKANVFVESGNGSSTSPYIVK